MHETAPTRSSGEGGGDANDGAPDGGGELRIYQTWKGSNLFLFHGRLIFGPDGRTLLFTISLIVVPVLVFCIFVASKLIDDFSDDWGITIMIVVIFLTICDIVALLLTSSRDPGIVPRNAHPPETEVELSPLGTPPSRLPRSKNVYSNGLIVKVKYCDTCMLYRPPRCSHCSICNNCVDKFDHHCPWIGQCIGLRNYRFYFMFVSTSTLLCLYIHGFCWVYVIKIMHSEKTTIWKAFIDTPASIVLIIYTFLLVWFVGGLTIFHLYLISTNQSTYENFRYRYDQRINPYNKGVSRNFLDVFCTSIPPSKNNFRGKVQKEAELSSRVGEGAFTPGNMGVTESNNMENGKKVKPGSSWGRSGNWGVPPGAVSTASEIGDSDRFTIAGDSSRRYFRQSSNGSMRITEINNMESQRKVKLGSSWGRSGNLDVPPEAVSTTSEIGDSDRFTVAGDSSRRYARQSSRGSIHSI